MKPKFITILGGEGSGKSTMINEAKILFPNLITTREPGGSPFAEVIRNTMFHPEHGKLSDVETQFFLAWAGRMDTMKKLVGPEIAKGNSVLSDRGDCCTFAYQIYAGGGKHVEELFWKIREELLNPKPDLYIFFDVNPATGLKRAASRKTGNNFFDEQKLPFHELIREGYIEFLKHVPHVVIDANQPLEQVKAKFATILTEQLV